MLERKGSYGASLGTQRRGTARPSGTCGTEASVTFECITVKVPLALLCLKGQSAHRTEAGTPGASARDLRWRVKGGESVVVAAAG